MKVRGDLPRSRMTVGAKLQAKEGVAAEIHGQYKPGFLWGFTEILGKENLVS